MSTITRQYLLDNVYVFLGADAKVGVTMLTSCISQSIARQGIDVLHIHLDGKFGNEYYKSLYEIHDVGLDDLKLKLKSGILNIEDIKSVCDVLYGNLYHISGVADILKKHDYTPNQIHMLLEQCNQVFDFVIVDAGSDIHLAMSIAALLSTDNRFIVLTQQYLAIKRFYDINSILENMSISFSDAIVNKYISYDKLPYLNDISKRIGDKSIISIPYLEYGWQCEADGISLIEFGHREFIMRIEFIARRLISSAGYRWDENKSIIRKGFGLFKNIATVFKNR